MRAAKWVRLRCKFSILAAVAPIVLTSLRTFRASNYRGDGLQSLRRRERRCGYRTAIDGSQGGSMKSEVANSVHWVDGACHRRDRVGGGREGCETRAGMAYLLLVAVYSFWKVINIGRKALSVRSSGRVVEERETGVLF